MKRKKKETPYLDFYEKCMDIEEIPTEGLCNCFGDAMDIFDPSSDGPSLWYWGYNGNFNSTIEKCDRAYAFTPLRHTIVLFLSCMNDEY